MAGPKAQVFRQALIAVILASALTSTPAIAGDDLFSEMFGLSGKKLQTAIAEADVNPLGSKENPVRVTMPAGERAYLDTLRCSDGLAPVYKRLGSTGIGPYKSILDLYEVRCETGAPKSSNVYMDMYHGNPEEIRPVPGFTVVSIKA